MTIERHILHNRRTKLVEVNPILELKNLLIEKESYIKELREAIEEEPSKNNTDKNKKRLITNQTVLLVKKIRLLNSRCCELMEEIKIKSNPKNNTKSG
jgi:hypothetical protein